jgi:hypothetical protein
MTAPKSPGSVSLPPKFNQSINLSSTAHNYDRTSLPTTFLWTREYAGGKVVASEPVYLDQPAPPSVFERALHTVALKVRRSSQESGETAKNRQWIDDRKAVYEGNCSFQVDYLGSVDVHDSKGIKICEDAIAFLVSQANKAAQKKDARLTGNHAAHLLITSDHLTVIDDETQNVIVEDTIQSISYCAAHRRREKYFAYITRLSPQQRSWTCHAFSANNATGERLSHAVGCAFEACHEKLSAVDESNSELSNSALPAASSSPTRTQSPPRAAAAASAGPVDVSVPGARGKQGDPSSSSKGYYQPVSLQMENFGD